MKHIYYLDVGNYYNEAAGIGIIGLGGNNKLTIVPTGTTIRATNLAQETESRELYEKLACDFGINFIFDNTIPQINFYAIPQIDIFATDNFGGYWATIGGRTDISNETDPICFIDNKQCTFFVSKNLNNFIYPLDTIDERIKNKTPIDYITFYESKKDAKEVIKKHNSLVFNDIKMEKKTEN